MLKTAKVRPLGGTSNEEVLSQLLSQFAYLIDEVGHLFDVYDANMKALDKRIAALESEAVAAADETEETVAVMSLADEADMMAAEENVTEENTEI